jgi:hypothetical protein
MTIAVKKKAKKKRKVFCFTINSKMNPQSHQIIVIGGGFSGLACARKLCLNGIRVTLIEARDVQPQTEITFVLFLVVEILLYFSSFYSDYVEELSALI